MQKKFENDADVKLVARRNWKGVPEDCTRYSAQTHPKRACQADKAERHHRSRAVHILGTVNTPSMQEVLIALLR